MEDIQSTEKHNFRLYSSDEEYPKNIDPKRDFVARNIFEDDAERSYNGNESLQTALDYRLKKHQVTGLRKNTRVALEYVLSVNDQQAWKNCPPDQFFTLAADWIEKRHGKGSVISISEHYDESNPHLHIVVVPLVTKDVHWKNKNGSGYKKQTRIDTKTFTGDRDKLRQLQTDYFKFCKSHEVRLGVEFFRGTLIENQHREYVEKTDHRIGRVRQMIAHWEAQVPHLLDKAIESIRKRIKSLRTHLLDLRVERNVSAALLVQEEKRKRDKNSGGKWKNRGSKKDLGIDPAKPKLRQDYSFKNKKKPNNNGMGGM